MQIQIEKLPWQKMGENVVIIAPHLNESFELNEVASEIWTFCAEAPRSTEDLKQHLLDEFDVESQVLQDDLDEVLGFMKEKALMKEVNA